MKMIDLIDFWYDLMFAEKVIVKSHIWNYDKNCFEVKVDIFQFKKEFETSAQLFEMLKDLYPHEEINYFWTDRTTNAIHIGFKCEM